MASHHWEEGETKKTYPAHEQEQRRQRHQQPDQQLHPCTDHCYPSSSSPLPARHHTPAAADHNRIPAAAAGAVGNRHTARAVHHVHRHRYSHSRGHHHRRTAAAGEEDKNCRRRGRATLAHHHRHRRRAWISQSQGLPTASGPWPPQGSTISDTRRPTSGSSPRAGAACRREGCKAALDGIRSSERERREGQCSLAVAGSTLLGSRAAGVEGAGSCRRGMEAGTVPEEAEENMIVAVAAEEGGSNRANLVDGVSDGCLGVIMVLRGLTGVGRLFLLLVDET